jgi:hypothetical protein
MNTSFYSLFNGFYNNTDILKCPAFPICSGRGENCDICPTLPIAVWRLNVRFILAERR